jgi:hypothetical protein
MCTPWDGDKRSTIKVGHKRLVIYRGGHQHDFESWVFVQEMLELEEQEIALYGAFVDLRKLIRYPQRLDSVSHLIDNNMRDIMQIVTQTQASHDDPGGTEQKLCFASSCTFASNGVPYRAVI